MDRAHKTWNDGTFYFCCSVCILHGMALDELPVCPGRPVVACPTLYNSHTSGQCREIFDTDREATSHWAREHCAPAIEG